MRPRSRTACCLRHLEIVVVEADGAVGERHAEHDPDVGVGRVAPTAASTPVTPARIMRPPMVGVPLLGRSATCGPSSRIGWPLPCLTRSRSMMPGPNSITNSSAVMIGAAGAERDVAEDVQRPDLVAEVDELVEHPSPPIGTAMCRRPGLFAACELAHVIVRPCAISASTSGAMRMPSDPLTITTSPARTRRARASAIPSDVGAQRPAARRRQRLEQALHVAGHRQRPDRRRPRQPARRAPRAAPRPSAPSSSMSPSTAMRRGKRVARHRRHGRRAPRASRPGLAL